MAAICLPKAEDLLDVLHLSPLITEIEQIHGLETGAVDIVVMVETARGVLHAHELAEGYWRVRAVCFGGEDLAHELGAVRTKTGEELPHARAQVVLAARATGVLAIDMIWTDLKDVDGLRAEARRARQLGSSGKLVVHPDQVVPVHEAFTPTAEEVDQARRVVQAFDAAGKRGDGVIALDGQMIDAPVVARAREMLKLAGVR